VNEFPKVFTLGWISAVADEFRGPWRRLRLKSTGARRAQTGLYGSIAPQITVETIADFDDIDRQSV
jgi:hypothetical protein